MRHPPNFKDLTGKQFGSLTVIKIHHITNWIVYWECKCKCGAVVVKSRSCLCGSKYPSCGKCKRPKQIHKCELCESTTNVCFNRNTGKYLCDRHRRLLYNNSKLRCRLKSDANKIIIEGDFSRIELYNNESEIVGYAIVDTKYVDDVRQYKWGKVKNTSEIGYVHARIDGKLVQLHRFLFNLDNKLEDNLVIDHINHDTLDNRMSNLRICTVQQNMMNCKRSKNNTSGVTGIWFDKSRNKWAAELMLNRKKKYLGRFVNKEDAIKARKEAEIKYFGDFAFNSSGEVVNK